MKDKMKITNIKIKYKDDKEAKVRFINFLVEYFLEKEIFSKKGGDT
ncbi:hypothetical protein [Caloranaerobacter sp. TR13]|nr:hypothetical protein [Caloranaerobacter sp. TR13]